MSGRFSRPIGYILAVIIGVLPAFFVLGAALFADGPSILSAERLVPLAIAYALLGMILGLIYNLIRSDARSWYLGIWISIPALPSALLFGRGVGPGYQLLYLTVTLACACVGAYSGMWIALRIRSRKSGS